MSERENLACRHSDAKAHEAHISRQGGQCCPEAQRWFHCLRHFWMRLFFPLVGLFSVVWFLVRVVPKPSRAAYPCQRAAFPLASSFVLWLVGLAGSIAMFRKARRYFVHARLVAAVMCLGLSVGIVWLLLDPVQRPAAAMDVPLPNLPLGLARGVQPGRVVWIHDPNATDWDGYNSTQPWYDDAHTDPAVVQKMVSRAIRGLAGESTEARAWDKLLRYFNQVRGEGIELTCPGATDFDGDSEVGFDDLAAFCSDWLMVSGTSPADLSGPVGDGVVNLRDFAVLARHWTVRRREASTAGFTHLSCGLPIRETTYSLSDWPDGCQPGPTACLDR